MTTPQYTKVAIALHWLIALMILGQIAGGLYMSNLPTGSSAQYQMFQLHKSFGLTVLFLSLVRLGWRLTHPAPGLPEGMKPWEKNAARFTHIAFYALMIGVPLGGWAVVSSSSLAASVPTEIFGVVPWPHIPGMATMENREAVHHFFEEAHEIFAFAILGLLALHVGAALKHHFIRKDGVLQRMLPFLGQKNAA